MRTGLTIIVLGVCAVSASADIVWDEFASGDLPDFHLTPAAFTLSLGENRITGEVGDMGAPDVDRDYFSIAVPAGTQLTAIILEACYSEDPAAFIGFQAGPIITVSPDDATDEDMLGYMLFGPTDSGFDLMPPMSVQTGRFAPPLAEGVYTFWVQQLTNTTVYDLNFVVAVPTPATGVLVPVMWALSTRRRTRHHHPTPGDDFSPCPSHHAQPVSNRGSYPRIATRRARSLSLPAAQSSASICVCGSG